MIARLGNGEKILTKYLDMILLIKKRLFIPKNSFLLHPMDNRLQSRRYEGRIYSSDKKFKIS